MKSFYKLTRRLFSGHLSLFASACSIIGLLIIAFDKTYSTIIALSAIIVFLTLTLIRIHLFLDSFLNQVTTHGFNKFASYVKYSTTDGKMIVYEVYKHIQCKKLYLDQHEHRFHWSGTQDPVISSELQDYASIRDDVDKYKIATFKFKQPLVLNDFGIVHVRMDLDDSNQASATVVSQEVHDPIQLLHFRVELKHCTKKKNARFKKKRLTSQQEYEYIKDIPFDTLSRSYEHTELKPEREYIYRLEWDR